MPPREVRVRSSPHRLPQPLDELGFVGRVHFFPGHHAVADTLHEEEVAGIASGLEFGLELS